MNLVRLMRTTPFSMLAGSGPKTAAASELRAPESCEFRTGAGGHSGARAKGLNGTTAEYKRLRISAQNNATFVAYLCDESLCFSNIWPKSLNFIGLSHLLICCDFASYVHMALVIQARLSGKGPR